MKSWDSSETDFNHQHCSSARLPTAPQQCALHTSGLFRHYSLLSGPLAWPAPGNSHLSSLNPHFILASGVSFLCYHKNTLIKSKQRHHSGFIWLTIPSYNPPFWAGVQAVSDSTGTVKRREKQSILTPANTVQLAFLPHTQLRVQPWNGAVHTYESFPSARAINIPLQTCPQDSEENSSLRFSFYMILGCVDS